MDHQPPPTDEDELKYLLLSEDEGDRNNAADALHNTFGSDMMRCIEYHHAGLNEADQQEVYLKSIERFVQNFRCSGASINRPLKPQLLRTAIWVGKEKYRKVSRTQERERGDLIEAVAASLRDSDLGQTWRDVADESFRIRVRDSIIVIAARLKPRQRQIAMGLAENWGRELTEKEAIDAIFRTSGERLTRDQFKRAMDEVCKKLREPVLKLLIEEGICPKNLTPEN
jgi:hypothetical protein